MTTPKFQLRQTVRFRESPRAAAHQRGVGTIIAVPADEYAPQSYGVHHRRLDSGRYEPFTAWYDADQLEPIDNEEPNLS